MMEWLDEEDLDLLDRENRASMGDSTLLERFAAHQRQLNPLVE